MLGRGLELLVGEKFHIWTSLKGSGPRRSQIRNKLEEEYKKKVVQGERATAASYDTSPTLSRSSSTKSVNSPMLPVGRVIVSVVRCLEAGEKGLHKVSKPRPGSPRRIIS